MAEERPVALITGAARGIGAATARRLARDGWAVVLVDRCADDDALGYPLATGAELRTLAAALDGIDHVGDVRSPDDVAAAVDVGLDRFGRLNAAIHAAGVIAGGQPIWETSDEAWNVQFDINVGGARNLIRAVVPPMLDAGDGRVVLVASAAAQTGNPGIAAYNASKAAVVGLTRGLAADLADSGVTANAVSPGSTDTAMLAESARIYGLASPHEFATHHLNRRLLSSDEVAGSIAWLCGPDASGITGAVIPVDAGMTTGV